MAMQLNAGDVGRSDVFHIAPSEIILGENYSRSVPHTQEQIEALAHSILDNGQQQPVICRRIEDKKVQLVGGFGRHAAVTYINTSMRPKDPIKLSCRIVDCNDEEAFTRNLVENLDRVNLSPIDLAHAQRRLREVFGWNDTKIANFFNRSVSHVASLRKVVSLSEPIQQEIAAGTIPLATAVDLTELPEAEREDVIMNAREENGTVNSAKVRKKVREKKQEHGYAKARTMKEVRDFFADMTGPAEAPAIKGMATAMLDFFAGKISDKTMENRMVKFCKED